MVLTAEPGTPAHDALRILASWIARETTRPGPCTAQGPEPVTGWTPDELTVLARTGSLRLTAGDEPGPEVELGMVTVRCALYVRAYRGPQSRWFRAAQEASRGRIRAGTIARDVLLAPAPGPADAIDAAYHAKYANSSDLVAGPQARAATLRIDPA